MKRPENRTTDEQAIMPGGCPGRYPNLGYFDNPIPGRQLNEVRRKPNNRRKTGVSTERRAKNTEKPTKGNGVD